MSSELSLVTVKPNRIVVQKQKSRRPSISTDRYFESIREEQYSNNQRAARDFIERTLSSKLSNNDLHETLKDGVLLCSLMNQLQKGIIPQISHKDLPFVKMENISNFLNAARQFGLHSSDLFQTVDLFEGKHMERVVATILALERAVEGKYTRRGSDGSIDQQMLNKFKNLDIKKSEKADLVEKKESRRLNVNKDFNNNNNKNNNHNNNKNNNHNNNDIINNKNNNDNKNNNNSNNNITARNKTCESDKTLVDIDPNSIIHHHLNKSTPNLQTAEESTKTENNETDNSQSNSDTTLQKKKPSLRKSFTLDQLFVEQKREEEELESEFAEDLAPLPISPAPTKSEKPVSRSSSTRSNIKTHVRYKSDRTSEISLNKNDKIPGYDYRRRESVGGASSSGDLLREKLVLKNEEEIIAQYQLGNCIGKGQFGAVYRALHLGTGQMVAVKRIKLEGKCSDEIQQLMQEVDLLKSLSHPSVVKYEAFIMTNDHINIILEYVENGSLLHTLKSFGNFPEKLVVSYVVKILEGLVYLHTKQVVHCDLKAANILTTKNGNVKLSDFGVSLNLKMMEQVSTEVAGTPNWMAPEVIELKGASPASDIWSLGCTIIELLTGKPPYSDLLAMTALFRIVEDDCPPLPENISDELTDFLRQCFHKKPSMRPMARELFRHDWIKNNWSLKELRTQESLPFLRRITSDTKLSELKTSSLSNISSFNDNPIENSNDESLTEPESTTPTTSKKPASSPSVATPTKIIAATPMMPHRFVKNSFSKPVTCKICHSTVKKHAVMCEECNMVCHTKCSPNAPFPCPLHNHMIRYIPIGLIDDPLPRINSIGASSDSDIPTITSPIGSLPTTSTPTPPKRRFVKKTKKEDSINSQISIADSVDSSASVTSNMADSSWYGNNSRSILIVDNNNSNNNNNNGVGGKGSGKSKTGKLKKKNDTGSNSHGSNGNGKKDDDCVIM